MNYAHLGRGGGRPAWPPGAGDLGVVWFLLWLQKVSGGLDWTSGFHCLPARLLSSIVQVSNKGRRHRMADNNASGSLLVTTSEGDYYVIPAAALEQFRATADQKRKI